MSRKLIELKAALKKRFLGTLGIAAEILSKETYDVSRDEYVRACVDNEVEGRLNKEELNFLGGFKTLKQELVVPPVIEVPKILLFDIETSPLVSYHWGLFDQTIGLNQMVKDTTMLSWSAKWYGSDEVMYADVRNKNDYTDDKDVVEGLWKLLDEADMVVAHNLPFDHKIFNSRAAFHKLTPPSSYKKIDTLRLSKKHFRFPSHKLEYLTKSLCTKFKKSSHAKFPGFTLWLECMKGNVEAFEEMKDYNEMDVKSLEELFTLLLPWENATLFNQFRDVKRDVCTCGSTSFKKHGFVYTDAAKYQRYICNNCGAETRSINNLRENKNKTRPTKR